MELAILNGDLTCNNEDGGNPKRVLNKFIAPVSQWTPSKPDKDLPNYDKKMMVSALKLASAGKLTWVETVGGGMVRNGYPVDFLDDTKFGKGAERAFLVADHTYGVAGHRVAYVGEDQFDE